MGAHRKVKYRAENLRRLIDSEERVCVSQRQLARRIGYTCISHQLKFDE